MELRTELMKVKGVQEVRLDDGWIEKIGCNLYLVAKIAVICCVLMSLAVFLVIGNSVRSDVYSSRSSIEVMKLLGATNHLFFARSSAPVSFTACSAVCSPPFSVFCSSLISQQR